MVMWRIKFLFKLVYCVPFFLIGACCQQVGNVRLTLHRLYDCGENALRDTNEREVGELYQTQDSSWVLRYDFRDVKRFDKLSANTYSPAVAVLLIENTGEKRIKIDSLWSSNWKLHVRGWCSERIMPLLYGNTPCAGSVELGTAPIALLVGITEKRWASHIKDFFIEYSYGNFLVTSNAQTLQVRVPDEFVDCLGNADCQTDDVAFCGCDNYTRDEDSDAISLKMYRLINLYPYDFAARSTWPVILARDDDEGMRMTEKDSHSFVLGFAALVVTNNSSDTVTIGAFNSGQWKLRIRRKSGETREINVLPKKHDAVNRRLAIKPGGALAVVCGCEEAFLDMEKVASFSVIYKSCSGEIKSNDITFEGMPPCHRP
ncbi:MAG: hypothetical protein IKK82_00445 [Kiritimatiellae bacterium]|nr:hypothetical protein [Kiritimatiellia bacterium]